MVNAVPRTSGMKELGKAFTAPTVVVSVEIMGIVVAHPNRSAKVGTVEINANSGGCARILAARQSAREYEDRDYLNKSHNMPL
jgi:hypothetical protein